MEERKNITSPGNTRKDSFDNSEDVRKLEVNQKFSTVGVVARITPRKDRNNRTFWDLIIMDEKGQIEGKIWANATWWDLKDPSEKKVLDPEKPGFIPGLQGKSLGVQGQVAEFRGQSQFNFNAIYFLDQSKYPPHEFVQKSPVPIEELESEFWEMVNHCGRDLKVFLGYMFSGQLWELFRLAPAAVTHHHAYVHGLLEHTLGVTRCARSIADTYAGSGMNVEVDLVVAGSLIHDIGKIEAYSLSPAPEMTLPGIVMDHIALGYAAFSRIAEDFGLDNSLKLSLGHILLSHHGCKEFGSPVLPATPEALIVAAADELDFKLFCYEDSVSILDEGKSVSEYNHSTGRRFWKRNSMDEMEV